MKPVKPMLCEIKDEAFSNPRWVWEKKQDGIRAIIELAPGVRRIQARSGTDKSHLFPELDIQVHAPVVLDGEIVSLDGKFNAVQHRVNRGSGIETAARDYPTKFVAFDLLAMNNNDVQQCSLEQRRQLLEAVLVPTPTGELSAYSADGVFLYQQAVAKGWEGVVGKSLDSTYQQGKRSWVKVKVPKHGTFFVCGYTPGTGWRKDTFGALVLGELDANNFMRHVGEVGTGFDMAEIAKLFTLLESRRSGPPLLAPGKSVIGTLSGWPINVTTWVTPFPVKVKYLEMSNDGILRFPVYEGMA